MRRYKLVPSSHLTKTGVEEICNPLPKSPAVLALQAEIYTGNRGQHSSPALRDVAVQLLCHSLFSSGLCLPLAVSHYGSAHSTVIGQGVYVVTL